MNDSKNPDFTLSQRLEICQQIARLVRAQLPISGSLAKSFSDSKSAAAESAAAVDQRVSNGQSLERALAGDSSRDARVLAACIESGQLSQRLDHALESWAAMHLSNARSSRELRSALIYPVLLITVTIAALGWVIWHLVPEYRTTYQLFNQALPVWLDTIVWIRESLGATLVVLALAMFAPLVWWLWRRRRMDANGVPAEPVRRMRLQALAASLASRMLDAQVPLNKIAELATRVIAGREELSERAFAAIQRQEIPQPLSRETGMVLTTLHAGFIGPNEASDNLQMLADHWTESAEALSRHQARWVPMLVAVTVGVLTVLTYAALIYLPWIWLLQLIVEPTSNY